jgi:hypothetical protein
MPLNPNDRTLNRQYPIRCRSGQCGFDLAHYAGAAHHKDLPSLVAAVRERCPWLVTFNLRHFQPGHASVTVLRPGKFVLQVRDLLARLTL